LSATADRRRSLQPLSKNTMNKSKSIKEFQESIVNANVSVNRNVTELSPVVENISRSLAEIDIISYIKITRDYLQASSEITKNKQKTPITKPGDLKASGVYLLIDHSYKEVHFYEITSAIKGYGEKMVSSILNSLPKNWLGIVVMDWSDGFWEQMSKKYQNLKIM